MEGWQVTAFHFPFSIFFIHKCQFGLHSTRWAAIMRRTKS